jgi:hypothetical protein
LHGDSSGIIGLGDFFNPYVIMEKPLAGFFPVNILKSFAIEKSREPAGKSSEKFYFRLVRRAILSKSPPVNFLNGLN